MKNNLKLGNQISITSTPCIKVLLYQSVSNSLGKRIIDLVEDGFHVSFSAKPYI